MKSKWAAQNKNPLDLAGRWLDAGLTLAKFTRSVHLKSYEFDDADRKNYKLSLLFGERMEPSASSSCLKNKKIKK